MALEFDCPYCKAVIRVPDNAAGKRGRCPKCATRLTIPKPGQSRRAGEEQPFFPGPPEPEAAVPAEQGDDVIFQEYDPAFAGGIDPEVEASLPPGDIAIPDLAGPGPRSLPQPPRQLPDSLLSRNKSKRRSDRWIWAITVFVLLAGAGAGGTVWWMRQSTTLTGELEAQVIEDPHLPVRVVPKSLIELSPADIEQVLSHLERNPATLTSNLGLATVVFQGGDRGLLVSVSPGSSTSLYRVDYAGDRRLRKYLRQHVEEYNRIRQEDLAVSVNEFVRVIRKSLKSREVLNAELKPFRDGVGFTSSVRGFGYFTVAVHRRQIYQCVYEDDEALYFLLPAGVKRFQIQGRAARKLPPYFTGEYEVNVTGSTKLELEEPDKSPPPKPAAKHKSDLESPPEDEAEMTSEK